MFARENFSALVVVRSGCGNGIASRQEIYELSEAMARPIVCVRFIRRVSDRIFLGYSNFFKNCIFSENYKIDRFKYISVFGVKSKLKKG